MPFLLAEILNFQGSAHLIGVGSLSKIMKFCLKKLIVKKWLKDLQNQNVCAIINKKNICSILGRRALWIGIRG